MINNDFWKLRSSEALYLVCSRVFIAVITLLLISDYQYATSSFFLFSFFLVRSVSGICLSNKLERIRKKSSLLGLSLLFLIITIVLYLLFKIGLVTIVNLIIIASALAIIDSAFSSIVDSYIPLIVPKESLESAYRKTSLVQSFVDLFGLALGMIGLELIGFRNILLIIIFLSTLIIFTLSSLKKIDSIDDVKTYKKFSTKESIKLFFHYKFEPHWAFLSLIVNMILLPFSMMIIPYFINNILVESPIYIGVIESAASIGVLISSYLLHERVSLFFGNSRTISFAFVIVGTSLVIMSYSTLIISWVFSATSIGIALVLSNVTMESKRASFIPQEHRVKIQTIHNAFINIANPIGFIIIWFVLSEGNYEYFLMFGGLLISSLSIFVYTIPHFITITECDKKDKNYIDLYGEL